MSLASAGLQMYGDYESSRGQAAGDQYRAEEMDRAAQYGELQATQTNAQMTRNIGITLGHLDAVNAAGRIDPTSPTAAAVRNTKEATMTNQKNIKVDSLTAQAQEDEANAAYMRFAGSQALLSGDIAMAGVGLNAVSGAAKSMGG